MSQSIDGARKTFLAGETAGANLRWYISDATTSPRTVSLCGAANPSIGVNEAPVLASGDRVVLTLANKEGTQKMVANGVITGGNKVFAAADGEIASSGTILEGQAFEPSAADQDIIEVMPTFGEDVDEDWADDELMEFGTGDDACILWSTGDASNHAFVIAVGNTSQSLHITDYAARATDWNVAADTHPTVYIHSNTTPATDYLAIGGHDGTTATINLVGGTTIAVAFAGTADFTFTANSFNVLTGSGIDLADSCNITFGTGDDVTIDFDGTNLVIATAVADTGAVAFGADDAGVDVILYGDTASQSITWDQSADDLVRTSLVNITGAGSTVVPCIPVAAQQTLAAGGGAVTITEYYTAGASDAGGDAWTLVDGAQSGQLKKIQLVTDGGGDATLTPTTLTGGTTITFADAGDYAILCWSGTSWVAIELGNDADGASAPVLA